MPLRPVALLLLLFAWAGCAAPHESASCRSGADAFFVRVENTAGYGPPEWQEREYLQGLDRAGRLFSHVGKVTPGSGRITFAPSPEGRINLSADEVREELVRLGRFDAASDVEVFTAWRAQVLAAAFDRFCAVVDEEWVTPRARDGTFVSCDDGGAATYRISTARGETVKRWDCAGGTTPTAAWASLDRIHAEWAALVDAADAAAGP